MSDSQLGLLILMTSVPLFGYYTAWTLITVSVALLAIQGACIRPVDIRRILCGGREMRACTCGPARQPD